MWLRRSGCELNGPLVVCIQHPAQQSDQDPPSISPEARQEVGPSRFCHCMVHVRDVRHLTCREQYLVKCWAHSTLASLKRQQPGVFSRKLAPGGFLLFHLLKCHVEWGVSEHILRSKLRRLYGAAVVLFWIVPAWAAGKE